MRSLRARNCAAAASRGLQAQEHDRVGAVAPRPQDGAARAKVDGASRARDREGAGHRVAGARCGAEQGLDLRRRGAHQVGERAPGDPRAEHRLGGGVAREHEGLRPRPAPWRPGRRAISSAKASTLTRQT
jgi:hypothetical protein